MIKFYYFIFYSYFETNPSKKSINKSLSFIQGIKVNSLPPESKKDSFPLILTSSSVSKLSAINAGHTTAILLIFLLGKSSITLSVKG